MKAVFLYDGNCSFCSDLANYWKQETDLDKIEFKSFRDLTEEELHAVHPSLTTPMCESDVQLVFENTRFPGFFAVRRMMFWSKKYMFVAVLLYLPLIPFVGMLTMYLLKKMRSRL
ncbi:DUF393 domain-containing protein [Leptospira ognonensis]|uniref:DUF393 domain-containing protein n=1 Tax=Leptospira ognonensis TaxID=2484945 RepID=A0A4R9K0P3_9LEPT|nr:DCC1-like thiol-disulfide oxidoreductase family protein [Leptospira ognonensis]TGL57518.1 DUF393 domain-containing protein [Leptospira ognonensis]